MKVDLESSEADTFAVGVGVFVCPRAFVQVDISAGNIDPNFLSFP